MPLVTTKGMFEKSMKEGFAIGAFNINNMEIIQGIVDAAQKQNSPVILQASSGAIKYARIKYLMKMVEAAVEETNIPIAIHLDHGPDFETCKMCIDNGFTSVMIDGSKYSFEENVALTKKVVDYAHERGVVVEAELGQLAGIEDDVNVSEEDAKYTDPDQAKEFVERTGCDSLAVAVGNVHGVYSAEPKIRFDIIEEVNKEVSVPLVLHGASGIGDEDIKKAIQCGIAKINIHTELCQAAMEAINEHKDEPFLAVERAVRQAVKERAMYKIKLFGDDGRADE